MPELVRTTYCHPERLREIPLDDGRRMFVRVEGSPTRQARAWEVNCWWEETAPTEAGQAVE